MSRPKSAEGALRPAATRKKSTQPSGSVDKLLLDQLSKAIKLARIMRGQSQRELALAVGSSQNLIWLLEQGRKDPGILLLFRIAESLRLPIEFFLVAISGSRDSSTSDEQKVYDESQKEFAAMTKILLSQLADSDDRPGRKKRSS